MIYKFHDPCTDFLPTEYPSLAECDIRNQPHQHTETKNSENTVYVTITCPPRKPSKLTLAYLAIMRWLKG